LCSTESGCRYGASCKFVHGNGDTAAANKVADCARNGADEAGLKEVTNDGVVTAMAGLSVVDESCSQSLPVNAADNSSASAAAGPTSTLSSASGAAAGAKCSRKKKKPAKKGTRKTKQESKSKELVLYDHQTVKCGRLNVVFAL